MKIPTWLLTMKPRRSRGWAVKGRSSSKPRRSRGWVVKKRASSKPRRSRGWVVIEDRWNYLKNKFSWKDIKKRIFPGQKTAKWRFPSYCTQLLILTLFRGRRSAWSRHPEFAVVWNKAFKDSHINFILRGPIFRKKKKTIPFRLYFFAFS